MSDPKEHVESIREGRHEYRVTVGGTMDGVNTRDPVGYSPFKTGWQNNLSVRMENIGDDPVANPWIIVGGHRNWRSIEDILAEILTDRMSDRDKAVAIWDFARKHRYHRTSADDEVKDTVKMLNSYGYTLCWDEAYTVSNLWQAAGLKIRRGHPHGHCTTEVFFDGRYNLLDSDEHLMILMRDNQTIADEADMSRDHDLIKRAHAYGITQGESRQTSESAASLFVYDGPRGGTRPFVGDHSMDMTLRPGESLVWEWEDRGKFHGYNEKPPLIANGRMVYVPSVNDAPIQHRIESPYVMVGGTVRGSVEGDATLAISWDGETWIHVTSEISGEFEVSLDAHFPPDMPARYAYSIRLEGAGLATTGLEIETDLQMAPLALPSLEVGENEIVYTDDSDGARDVRITHTWRERNDIQPPAAPPSPGFPADGARVPGTQWTFEWEPVDGARDYHVELSEYADMRICASPTFEKLISKTPSKGRAEWRIPFEGLLNPDTPYYWRVRARGDEGLWGPWSDIWSFTLKAPGVPLNLRIDADHGTNSGSLHWSPNPDGTAPVRFEIYSSDERGFTASDEDYPVVVERGGKVETFPANRCIGSVDQTSLQVLGPDSDNHCYYRVIAVDADGNRSGPSDYAEAPRPFISTVPPATAKAGERTEYAMRATASIGELRATSEGDNRYVSSFMGADSLRFTLDEGPPFTALDPETGVFTAEPEARHAGLHTVTLRVENGNGGVAVQGFDLEVVV